jgi:hypothetical protein
MWILELFSSRIKIEYIKSIETEINIRLYLIFVTNIFLFYIRRTKTNTMRFIRGLLRAVNISYPSTNPTLVAIIRRRILNGFSSQGRRQTDVCRLIRGRDRWVITISSRQAPSPDPKSKPWSRVRHVREWKSRKTVVRFLFVSGPSSSRNRFRRSGPPPVRAYDDDIVTKQLCERCQWYWINVGAVKRSRQGVANMSTKVMTRTRERAIVYRMRNALEIHSENICSVYSIRIGW